MSLFETGSSLSIQPIRMIYLQKYSSENFTFKIGFAVPKKNFKRAVDRNLIKRRMREAYRQNKLDIIKQAPDGISSVEIMLVYQGQKIEDFEIICDCIKRLLKKLEQRILKD
jgi:ribonuclease P protein component